MPHRTRFNALFAVLLTTLIALVAAQSAALPLRAQSVQSAPNQVFLPLITDGRPAPEPSLVPEPAPGSPEELAMRREVIRLVNSYRVANGCPAAAEDVALITGAQAWSEYMDTNNYFEHSSTVDVYWYRQYGYPTNYFTPEENVGSGHTSAQEIFDGWRNSPNHNRTLLSCRRFLQGDTSYKYQMGVGLRSRRWTLALNEYYAPSPTPTP